MLEKNKDYIEMRVSSTDCAFTQNEPTSICVDGYVYTSYIDLPDPGELYIIISKDKFEKLQESVADYMALSFGAQYRKDKCEQLQSDLVYYKELATQWESNYRLLLAKTGFTSIEDLIDYIHDPSMTSPEDKTFKEIIEECEEDYISERDKAETLKTENEQLKKKLHEFDPIPDYKELLEKLYSKEDAEKLEWTLNHICGGRASSNGWMVTAKLWRRNYETLSKLVGFSSTEEIQDYLTNDAECDTLQEAVSKLKDQVKYTCDEWYSANSNNNSWKAAAECNSPKELIEKREALEKEIEVYSRALQEWKEITGYPSPSAVKTALESGASWHHAYSEAKEVHKKLADSIKSWQDVTGYATPEEYLAARISGAFHTPFDYTAAWQKATGCNAPDDVKKRIKALTERIDDSEACYNHLLMLTGFSDEGEIEDALDQCDHSTLRKALVDYEFDYEELLKLTGYPSNQAIRALLHGDKRQHYNMRDLINTLTRNAKFTESNWQHATGCDTPGRAEEKLEFYKERLGKVIQEASCAAKHLENIMS